ncbi:MAG: hypothetical protein Q9208_002765 [Pyrenodesmia sp. 3 TL-2023]
MGATQSSRRRKAPASTAATVMQPTSAQPSLPQPTAVNPEPTVIPSPSTLKQHHEDAATGLIIQTSHFNGRVIRPKPHRRAKATQSTSPSTKQKYTAYNPDIYPFQYFTKRGLRPLDEDADVVWEHYKGWYYASRLSKMEHDPLHKPKLITEYTAPWVIPNAKRGLTQAKRKRTGDRDTRWDTEVPAAKRTAVSRLQPPATATAHNGIKANDKGASKTPKKQKVSHTEDIRRPVSPKKQRVAAGWIAVFPPPAPAPPTTIDDAVWIRRPDLDIVAAVAGSWIGEAEQAGWFDGYVDMDADGIDASFMDDYDCEFGFQGV